MQPAASPLKLAAALLPAKSGCYFLQRMWLEPKQLKKVNRDTVAAVKSSSRWLWLKRAHSWDPSAGEG